MRRRLPRTAAARSGRLLLATLGACLFVFALASLGAQAQSPPDVSIAADPSSITEGETITFTLAANPAPTTSIEVSVEVTRLGFFAFDEGATHMVSIAMNPGSAELTLTIEDDKIYEPNGRVRATVQAGAGYSAGDPPSSVTVTVIDKDDVLPGAPKNLTLTPCNMTIRADWEAPDDLGSSNGEDNKITGYSVQYREGATGSWTVFSVTPPGEDATSISVTISVPNGLQHQVRVARRLGPGEEHLRSRNKPRRPGQTTPSARRTASR